MTKVDIFSGFLGAGKTTLIKKLIAEAYRGEKLVLIENEFGEIGIDGGFMQEAGIEVTEMNSGCICCSLQGDFGKALQEVLNTYHPDRILIEPSGVGKLSDVIEAVRSLHAEELHLNACVTVADAGKCKLYMKNFGEFYNNQLEHAGCIVLSRTNGQSESKLADCLALLRAHNAQAPVVTTPWDNLNGAQILEAMEGGDTLAAELLNLVKQAEICPTCGHDHGHHHDHEEHDCGCGHDHGHHHDHEEHDCGCGHDHEHHNDHKEHDCGCGHDHEHHHDHEEHDCGCGQDHEHHHDHEEHECGCGHHHENHDHHDEHACSCGCGDDHHHHDADEVFQSWGFETAKHFTKEGISAALEAFADEKTYGLVLRAKGIVPTQDGAWLHFDYVPGEIGLREGTAAVTGRLCVIGAALCEDALAKLFQTI